MKCCDYCGKENENGQSICAGCGCTITALISQAAPPVIAPPFPPVAPPPARELRAGLASGFFCVYIAAQFVGGLIAGVIGGAAAGIQPDDVRAHPAQLDALLPWTILFTMLFGGAGVVWMALGMELPLGDASPTGPAWVRGSWRDIGKGLAIGTILSLLWVFLMMGFGQPPHSGDELGPMTRMGVTPGPGRIVWIIAALLLAPPIEELLFRGIFYAGYRKSFGAPFAAFATTGLFVFLHYTEFVYQPLAIVAITGLALITLQLRLRYNAIGPSIAAHFGYNAVIGGLLFFVK